MSQPALAGRRILVTRSTEGNAAFAHKLALCGAEVLEVPLIRLIPPDSYEPLDHAFGRLAEYDILLITSAHTAQVLAERKPPPWPAQPFTAGVGPGTAKAMTALGLRVDLQSQPSIAESLLHDLASQAAGKRILLPRAAVARGLLPEGLRAVGARVDVVHAYRNVPAEESKQKLAQIVAAEPCRAEAVTFTSASTVDNFFALLGEDLAREAVRRIPAASIGPITTAALERHGARPACEAEEHDLDGLARALSRLLA